MPTKRRVKNGVPNDPESADAAFSAATRLISYRQRSIKETAQKLSDHGFEQDAIGDAIERLVETGLLDDGRFARELSGSRIRNKNWGIGKIAFDLRSKGIPDDIIQAALSEIDPSVDVESARRALEKWARKMGVEIPPERSLEKKLFEKAFRHLSARGFSAHVIMTLLKGVDRRFL